MDLHFFGTADYAMIDQAGKLSIVGIFNRLNFTKFPNAHPVIYLVAILQPSFGEVGDKRGFMIRLMNEDGQEKFKVQGEVRFRRGDDGRYQLANIVIPFRNMPFDEPGRYEFILLIDNHRFASTQLEVMHNPPPQE